MQLDGIILKGIGGFYYVEAADRVYECKARGIFRKDKITPLAGDYVTICVDDKNSNENVIEQIRTRKNSLNRPPVANLDKLVIISSVCRPNPSLLIIDRLTAAAEHMGIKSVVVFSKSDLKDTSELEKIYTQAGIPAYSISNVNMSGVQAVNNEINGCICAFTGNSGVGKSSLINSICKTELKTNEISEALGRGKHTTRSVELIKWNGGYIADTPGFSSIDFESNCFIDKEQLPWCFPEFNEYLGKCKFSSCTHIADKGCLICEAVKNGRISKSRHESYVAMFNEVKDIKEWQR